MLSYIHIYTYARCTLPSICRPSLQRPQKRLENGQDPGTRTVCVRVWTADASASGGLRHRLLHSPSPPRSPCPLASCVPTPHVVSSSPSLSLPSVPIVRSLGTREASWIDGAPGQRLALLQRLPCCPATLPRAPTLSPAPVLVLSHRPTVPGSSTVSLLTPRRRLLRLAAHVRRMTCTRTPAFAARVLDPDDE